MKITSDKENRKSPLWSLFLLIIGGGLALMGDRWLATRTASTVPPSIAETPVETAPPLLLISTVRLILPPVRLAG